MILVIIYAIAGTALFIYLFLKFIRRGLRNAQLDKLDVIEQHRQLHRKLRSDPIYLLTAVGLLAGVFIFAATVAWLLHIQK